MAIGIFEEVTSNMKSGVYDFTNNGECSNCGQCCSNFLPMSDQDVKRIERYIKKNCIKEQKHFIAPLMAQPYFDFTCPFRDNENKKCVIYDVRPAICKDFKCDKPKKQIYADRDMYEEVNGIFDVRKTFFR